MAIPELDTYDMGNLDTREYGAMDMDARRAAEEEIARRYVCMGGLMMWMSLFVVCRVEIDGL